MKKLLAIILTLALTVTLTGTLSGCEREKKPLRVLIDINPLYGLSGSEESVSQELIKAFFYLCRPFYLSVPEKAYSKYIYHNTLRSNIIAIITQ